jgi:hypothetical protein
MILSLMAVVGLGCDLGSVYLMRQRLQAAADASALASASMALGSGWADTGYDYWQRNRGGTWSSGSYSGAGTEASPYLNRETTLNGDRVSQYLIALSGTERTVKVSCTRFVPYAFLALVGRSGASITVSATAKAQESGTYRCSIIGYNQAPTEQTHTVDLDGNNNSYGTSSRSGVYSAQNVHITGNGNQGSAEFYNKYPPPGNSVPAGFPTRRSATLRGPSDNSFDRGYWDRPMPAGLTTHEGDLWVLGSRSGNYHVRGDLVVFLYKDTLAGTFYVDGSITVIAISSANRLSGYFRCNGSAFLGGGLDVDGVLCCGENLNVSAGGSSNDYSASFACGGSAHVDGNKLSFTPPYGTPGSIVFWVGFNDSGNRGGMGSGHDIVLDGNNVDLSAGGAIYDPYGHIAMMNGNGVQATLMGDTITYSGNSGVFPAVLSGGGGATTVSLID